MHYFSKYINVFYSTFNNVFNHWNYRCNRNKSWIFYILPTWGSKLTIIICLYGACIKKSWQLIIRNINNISYIYISLSLEHLLMDRKKHVNIYIIWLVQFILSIAINSAKTYVSVIMKTYTVIFGQFFCHFHSKPLYSFHYFPKKKKKILL